MSTVKCATIVNASSATNNLSLDASGNVTVGAGLTLTGGALTVGGSVGSAGQILKSNGTTSSWVNGWTLINTITGTGAAALQDTTSLTSTYANYMIVVRDLLTATNAVTIQMQLYVSGSYRTTGYSGYYDYAGGGNGPLTTYIPLSYPSRGSNVYQTYSTIFLSNPSSSTVYKPVIYQNANWDTSGSYYAPTVGASTYTAATTAITGFQILASSGNITGTVQVYGSN